MDTDSRRLELQKLEALGFSQVEIVKELSQKAACSKRIVYNDFETWSSWQSVLQSVVKAERFCWKSVTVMSKFYRQASMRFLIASNELAKLGALNIMLKANSLINETGVLPEALGRLRDLEDKARRGVRQMITLAVLT